MFIVAKFAESGILNEYLNDSCGKKKLNLCACKNDITPYPWDFMWPQAGSSLSNLGGWEKCKPEFNMIIHDVFTTPKYTKMFIEKAATSTIRQLTEIQDLGKPINMPPGHLERAFVKEYFDDEDKEFLRSKQNNDQIDPFIPNVFYYLFFALSSIWILLVCSQSANKQIFYLYLYIIAFLVVNAFVTSVFSTVSGRFQARIFWILPATNAILILKYFQKKYIDKIQLRD